jgi:uncharacterized membrane protein YhaH (DUF805 family)
MGAFGELFGFEGRIDRLGYLWRSLAVGLGMGFLAVVGGAVLAMVVRPLGLGGFETGSRALAVSIMLLAMWSSAAIASRRLRDLGLEPVHFVPAYFALWVVYSVLLRPLGQLEPQTYGAITACWAVLQALPTVALLFWPGHQAPEVLPAGYEPPQPTAYLNWRGQS